MFVMFGRKEKKTKKKVGKLMKVNIGIAMIAAGGPGSVVMPSCRQKGLRNRRKAYWAKVRLEERRKREAALARQEEQTVDRYAEYYNYGNN
jgi:hypothetical protein